MFAPIYAHVSRTHARCVEMLSTCLAVRREAILTNPTAENLSRLRDLERQQDLYLAETYHIAL